MGYVFSIISIRLSIGHAMAVLKQTLPKIVFINADCAIHYSKPLHIHERRFKWDYLMEKWQS